MNDKPLIDELRKQLEVKISEEIKVLAYKMKIPKFRRKTKTELIEQLIANDEDELRKVLNSNFSRWDRYKSYLDPHGYGFITTIGCLIGMLGLGVGLFALFLMLSPSRHLTLLLYPNKIDSKLELLRTSLEKRKVKLWEVKDVPTGIDWQNRIEEALKSTKNVIIFISNPMTTKQPLKFSDDQSSFAFNTIISQIDDHEIFIANVFWMDESIHYSNLMNSNIFEDPPHLQESSYDFSIKSSFPKDYDLSKDFNVSINRLAVDLGGFSLGHIQTLPLKPMSEDERTIRTLLNMAESAFLSGHFDKALRLYNTVIEIEPDNSSALFNKGVILFKTGFNETAISIYNTYIRLYPLDIKAWFNLGSIFKETGQYQESLNAYDEAMKIEPNLPSVLNNKANLLHYLGKTDEAIKAIERALELDPTLAIVWYNYGVFLKDLGRDNEAIHAYDNAISINPQYINAWRNRGKCFMTLKFYQNAIDSFEEVIKINPHEYISFNDIGTCLHNLKRYEEALEMFDKAININPNIYYAWYNRGNLLVDLGNFDESIISYDQALKIEPENEKILSNKAAAFYRLGKFEVTLKIIDQIIELDENNQLAKRKRRDLLKLMDEN